MPSLAPTVFASLRRMDEEACTPVRGAPTGLNWFGGHAKPELKRPQTECCWSDRLAELLREAGFDACRETRYPAAPKLRCDLLLIGPDGRRTWLEIKGAWKHWWSHERGNDAIYRAYLLDRPAPGSPAGRFKKDHSAYQDLDKLARLTREDADRAAFLLIGFDSAAHPMRDDVAELRRDAGLDREPWSASADDWADPYRGGERVRCWLWERPVA